MPFFNVDEYGASTRTGERFLYDGHTSSTTEHRTAAHEVAGRDELGPFHENMPEIWLNVWGNVCALISGEGVVHGEYGDLINAMKNAGTRATSCPTQAEAYAWRSRPAARKVKCIISNRSAGWELRTTLPRDPNPLSVCWADDYI